MSAAFGAPPVHSTLDEDAWDDLLTFIEDKRVIPIVGPELLEVDTPEGPRLLHDWLAEKLALRLGLERCYRSLARLSDTADQRVALVDRANSVRPVTWV